MSLFIAVYGHIIVGSLRLLGFRVFRHAYRPLLATSIVEFWNRWSYYYKELLTDFFFYPTFLRCAWAGPRLRLFLAVFAAAAVGNMYFVILWEVNLLLAADVHAMWTRWGSRTVYCVMLAVGIWVSMLRQQRERKRALAPRKGWSKIRAALLVCSFYAVAHVWNIGESALGPLERLLWLLRVAW
jgi:D-alanyl-lipoteichoic acid acyltransferase DltB (MBOAT superfamily)